MTTPTIAEALEVCATGPGFADAAAALLSAAGLTMPSAGSGAPGLLKRILAQVPAVHWLLVGERLGAGVEHRAAAGKRSTTVTCHRDPARHIVVEHHVHGHDGDDDYEAWALVSRLPNAARADAAWAKLARKYRFEGGASLEPKAPEEAQAPGAGPRGSNESALLDAWWSKPADDDALRVLADAWSERGEPRGEFIALSMLADPTAAQRARREALLKKHGGALVGPARPFLREWELDERGVVGRARCEADKLAEGIEEIGRINPGLCLNVTSLKKQSTIAALAKVSLARLHFVSFTMGVIGSLGGTNVSDKALIGVAPAFRKVKHLALQARGYAPDCFTPEGLAKFADQVEGLEFFALDFYTDVVVGKVALPPLERYVDVVTSHRAFKGLKAVIIEGASDAQLGKLPLVRTVITADGLHRMPSSAAALAALVAG
jgi:uncharacterized protein (TIGR02996 family)